MNFLNNTFVTLEAPVASSDRVIFAKKFVGNLGENFPLSAVLQEADSTGTIIKREIIRITGKNNTMLNVERAVEPCPQSDTAESPSRNPLNFSENAVIFHTLTAGDLKKIIGKIDEKLGKSELRAWLNQGLIMVNESGEEISTTEIPQFIKNQFSLWQKYILWEDLPAKSQKNFENLSLKEIGLKYTTETNNNLGDIFEREVSFERWNFVWTITLDKKINITKIVFNHHTQAIITAIKEDNSEEQIYNWSSPTNLNPTTANRNINISNVKKIKVTINSWGTSSTGLRAGIIKFSWSYEDDNLVLALESLEKKNHILFEKNKQSLSADKVGFKMQFPTNVKLGKIRTFGKNNTSAKVFLMQWNQIIKEVVWVNKIFDFENFILEKNIEYSLVLNNSWNFENNASYINLSEAKKYFKYITTWTSNSQNTDKIAGFGCIEINYDNKVFLANGDVDNDFVGFSTVGLNEWTEVNLGVKSWEIISFNNIEKWKKYKIFQSGLISSIFYNENENPKIIGEAVSEWKIKLTNEKYFYKNLTKSNEINANKRFFIEILEDWIITLSPYNNDNSGYRLYYWCYLANLYHNTKLIRENSTNDSFSLNVAKWDIISFDVLYASTSSGSGWNPKLNINFKCYTANPIDTLDDKFLLNIF